MLLKSPLGLINVGIDDQRLLFDGIILENAKSLSDSGITVKNAQAMSPAQLTLAVRDPSSELNQRCGPICHTDFATSL